MGLQPAVGCRAEADWHEPVAGRQGQPCPWQDYPMSTANRGRLGSAVTGSAACGCEARTAAGNFDHGSSPAATASGRTDLTSCQPADRSPEFRYRSVRDSESRTRNGAPCEPEVTALSQA